MTSHPERFTDQLRAAADPIWAAQHAHPFVLGIGDGTLDLARFSYFIRQDFLFLIDYARMLALGDEHRETVIPLS